MPHGIHGGRRWLALIVLCLGELMIVLDSTIVNVALPSIRADLGFSETSLVWVVNAYLLTFGGFLLLGGRLGDLYGGRRVFLIAMVVFTLASLACGLATSQVPLVWARAVQGIGGAAVSAVALSLTMNMFPDTGERAKAMGIFGFVCSGGGSLGVLFGGVLTTSLNWHWIFLVNIPIGVVVYALCMWLIPPAGASEQRDGARLDVLGAITVTASLMLAVYAVVNGNEAGWMSKQSIGLLSAAVGLMVIFVLVEMRVRAPLVPLTLFRSRAIVIANLAAVLWAAAMFAWFFMCSLYMQRVLGYDGMHISFAFLPPNLIGGGLSLGVSAKLVMRFGLKTPFAMGMLVAALGLWLFVSAPVKGELVSDILPGMILMGLGSGVVFNPLLLAAMGSVPPGESGLASGVVNTSFMMGGALGLAILASAASAWTTKLSNAGVEAVTALNGGYHVAFAIGTACAVAAALLGAAFLPSAATAHLPEAPVRGN